MNIKKFGVIGTAFVMLTSTFGALSVDAAANRTITQNEIGTIGSYDYEFWTDVQPGASGNKATMTLKGEGSFTADYDTTGNKNTLMRTGKKFGGATAAGQTHNQMGNIVLDYEVDYNPEMPGASYMCVYGWTRADNNAPLVEFYIVESWGEWVPSSGFKGSTMIGGELYNIYESDRINQPSIIGDTTFKQYWSIRANKKGNGIIKNTIPVSEHFKTWEGLGMKMGSLYEVSLCIEGYNSRGTADVIKNEITIGGEYIPVEPEKPEIPKDGIYYRNTFESSSESWASRGDSSVEISKGNGLNDSSGLAVTGRTDTWNGTGKTLSTTTFVPGNEYSFSTWVMHKGTGVEDFKLTLQCDVAGETDYITVAEGSSASGEWLLLENKNFSIPAGASNLLLYVEVDSNGTLPFFIDEAFAAVAGTPNPAASTTPQTLVGDVNGDKKIDSADVKMLKSYTLGATTKLTDANASDINNDKKITVLDVILLKKMIIKNETTQPVVTEPPVVTDPPIEEDNHTMYVDFKQGISNSYFEKADGWSNGDCFDCVWRGDNIFWTDNALNLRIDTEASPEYNYSGAEYRSVDYYHYGYYETSMKAIKNDGVVSSFFTYTGPYDGDPWDEIDIEILGKDTTKVQFNYYTNGVGNHEFMYDLGFDASQGFHTYGFDWQPDKITWYVDGKAVYTAYSDIPKTPGKIMMNTWPGIGVNEWLKPYDGKTPLTAQYKYISFDKAK
ncbi:MAG: family 16 glycosylhydrolase [Clostridiales bacterium]|nr:family 16 glycosylhydrolase [Clostridiales bacterium]